jgi:hypothetical protein
MSNVSIAWQRTVPACDTKHLDRRGYGLEAGVSTQKTVSHAGTTKTKKRMTHDLV